MNFLPGTWDAEARAVRLPDGTAVPVGRPAALPQGSPVTLGIRPEHVRLDGEGDDQRRRSTSWRRPATASSCT